MILIRLWLVLCLGFSGAAPATPQVKQIDDLAKESAASAHTAAYRVKAVPRLIVRRASSYYFTVTTTKDDPAVEWAFTLRAKRQWGTNQVESVLPVADGDPDPGDTWYIRKLATVVTPTDLLHRLQVHIPSEAEVGQYEFSVEGKAGIHESVQAFPKPVVVLFNPWAASDAVYYADAKERKEYVETEDGQVTWEKQKVRGWRFGQFDESALDMALYLMKEQAPLNRKSPAAVAREISGSCNTRFWAKGFIVGNWSGDFSGGKSPEVWTGTDAILKEYMRAAPPYKPVKYGQCWNFACVATTFLRTLGIPSRPVSAHGAAVDNDVVGDDPTPNGHVDEFQRIVRQTPKGNVYGVDDGKTIDRTWAFHVWTEASMKRPDLTDGGGWQELDPTSQSNTPETIEGLTVIGPASRALLRVATAPPEASFDTGFMWSTVRADKRVHYQKKAGEDEYVHKETKTNEKMGFGKVIKTKHPGRNEMANIAALYRPAPRSTPDPVLAVPSLDVQFGAPEFVGAGSDVTGMLSITNNDASARDVVIGYSAGLFAYNGELIEPLASPELDPIQVLPGESVQVPLTIPGSQSAPLLNGTSCAVRFSAVVNCEEIDEIQSVEGSTILEAPPVEMSVSPSGPVALGGTASVFASYTNSTPLQLTGVSVVYGVGVALEIGGASSYVVNVGGLAPGQTLTLPPVVVDGVLAAHSFVQVTVLSDQLPASVAYAYTTVASCAGDFTGDSLVDDDDFVLFAAAYHLTLCTNPEMPDDCPSDLNHDGFVDDGDFVMFVAAYEMLECP